MDHPDYFISCDWGTSNFRLRVVATHRLTVHAEHATDRGIRGMNENFVASGRNDRAQFFTEYLDTQLGRLPAAHRGHPLIVSGMASANIGMLDLPYGDLPIDSAGTPFIVRDLFLRAGQPLRLVSGIKSANGIMRGEETQALGLLDVMSPGEDGTLLLPGTHSKHLVFSDGRFTDFTSYLTGELFELLSRMSILSNSVVAGSWDDGTAAPFATGVEDAFSGGCSPLLFGIRAGHILRNTDPGDNYYRLSGLLIGEELSHLPKAGRIYLAGSGPLLRLYHVALQQVVGEGRLTVYDGAVLERALLFGQREMLLRSEVPES